MKIKKYISVLILFIFLISQFTVFSNGEVIKTTDISDYRYNQKIITPFDTSFEVSKYQPIDIEINFDNPCFAESENDHSVRIFCDIGSEFLELESQIYNLKKTDDKHISSCNIVFLVPEEADGKETYLVYYDSEQKNEIEYENHLEIVDSHYYYEPISGQKIDLDYYGIKENDDFVYAICQTGELLGNPVSLSVIKFKPETKVVETYNIDQLAVFDMRYGINPQPGYEGTSWAKNVKKTVLVDGNLMIRIRLEGKSPKENILSDNIYTYYYSPTENKNIVVDCYHEVLEDIKVEEPSLLDGTYGGIVSIKSRSSTIEKMNVGSILPELYVYSEGGTINDFSVPQNPSTVEREAIVSTEDDIDLGGLAWVCSKDPKKNLLHGLILDSNTGFTDNDDGVQVKAWVKENINYPGLEADTGNLYISRNSYENNKHSPDLDKGFNVNYKSIFFTLNDDEIDIINEKSKIFQKFSTFLPVLRENITKEETEKEKRFTLTTYVHNAPSFPLGSLFSALRGKKFPYIYAELYKDNNFKSSGSVNRLTLGSVDLDLEGKTLFEKIKTVIGLFDFRNSTFFKKIIFPDIEEGTYVVKIFRENPLFSEERKYIGFGIIDVNKNTTLRITCTSETKSKFKITDQKDKPVTDVEFFILSKNNIISDGKSDKNGTIHLKAPSSLRYKYQLKVLYKGFLITEEEIKLGLINQFKTFSKNFNIEIHDLKIKLKDKWGFKPAVDVTFFLTSDDMIQEIKIPSDKIDRGNYVFEDLPSSIYDLYFKYKSFEFKENINLDRDRIIDIVSPAEYITNLNILNRIGNSVSKGTIYISRNDKKIESKIDENGFSSFTVPPGKYKLEINIDEEKVAFQDVDIKSQKTLDIVTDTDSFIHIIVPILSIIFLVSSLVYLVYKKKFRFAIKLSIIFLLIISIFQSWWVLYGEENGVSTSTETFLYPPRMISFTESMDSMGGSVSMLPSELTALFTILSIILFVSIIFVLSSIFIENKLRKTSKILLALSAFLIIVSIALFYYAVSLLTELGVGSFMGSGEILTNIPGKVEGVSISSSWGPGVGFYLAILSLIIIILSAILKKFRPSFK